jgi:predicted dehydrogenase
MKKLKFAIVGCGRIATLHVKGYRDREDAELYGVFDVDQSAAEKFAKEHGIPKVYESYAELLADGDIAGVELLVPHHLHCGMTIQACEAKKNVSVQKPMALSLGECDKMIDAAKENGVKLKVFENFVFYPPYRLAKKMIDEGEIGEPLGMRYKMNDGGLGSVNTPGAESRAESVGVKLGVDLPETGWKVDPKSYAWRHDDAQSGGGPLVFDDGYHKFSIILYMLGAVEKVSAWIDATEISPGVYKDAPAVLMWKHKDKKVYGIWDILRSEDMYVQSKYYTCDERMEITGSRGVIWVTRCTASMLPDVAPVVMYRDGKLSEYWDMPHDWADAFIGSTHDFIDCIKEDREPFLSGEQGKEVLRFALAAIDSSEKKQEVYLEKYRDEPRKK